MTKEDLIQKAKNGYSKEQMLAWIQALPSNTSGKLKPTSFKKGDVLYNVLIQHPVVIVSIRKDYYICIGITSEETCPEIFHPMNSRIFEGWFTSTIVITKDLSKYLFRGNYDNNRHLNEVYKELKKLIWRQ